MKIQPAPIACLALSALAAWCPAQGDRSRHPNVIIVMTDDQGYGDLHCHGNEIIDTPNLDRLREQSARFTNFHVDPTCSETRAALMTGRYSSRTGVWHTIMGRSLLRRQEQTMGDVFAANGYRTGVFGKWHLGDNFPYRPQDRGFQEVLIHGGGGVGQTPDWWGNDYFDDTYWHNGKPEPQSGYCTDVFFEAATKFITDHREQPFFVYLPTNAAHGPYNVADSYRDHYLKKGVAGRTASFYGMITNIDENVGRLSAKLEELDLARDTILIFMTDNGSAAGAFNAGMRGKKGSHYDGGHRVPFFIRWPGRLAPDRDIQNLAAHIDVLPTLVELCELEKPAGLPVDGSSLAPLLEGRADWADRVLLLHSQRIGQPQKWRKSSVMTDRWRFIDGKELFDMYSDPGQVENVVAAHPEVAANLTAAYDRWWDSLTPRFTEVCRIDLCPEEAPVTRLTCHDWHTNEVPLAGRNANQVPWNQRHIIKAPAWNGYWTVDVLAAGTYEFTLCQQPREVGFPIAGERARIRIGDVDESMEISQGASAVTFRLALVEGAARLRTWFTGKDSRGAFFVYVQRVD